MKNLHLPLIMAAVIAFSGCGNGSATPVDISITGKAYIGSVDPANLLSPDLTQMNDPARVESQLYLGVYMDMDGNWVNEGATCSDPDPLQVSFSFPMSLDASTGAFSAAGPMPQHQDKASSDAPSSCSTARDGIHINELQKLKLEIWFPSNGTLCEMYKQSRCAGAADPEDCEYVNKVWACPGGRLRAIIQVTGAELTRLNDEIQSSGKMTISTDLVFEPKDPNEIN